jgi:hypothetical protein
VEGECIENNTGEEENKTANQIWKTSFGSNH